MKKILVIGSINVDLVFNTEHLPLKGETLFAKHFETHFGGKGANQAFTAGRLGADVELMGVVGDDDYGRTSKHNLQHNGCVAVDRIAMTDKFTTGIANIVVAKNGDNHIIVNSGANFHFEPDYIDTIKTVIDEKDIIIFQLEIPLEVVETLAKYAKDNGKTVILNPAPGAKLSDELLQNTDYLVPNETELAILSGLPTNTPEKAIAAAKMLQKAHKIPALIVTLGEHGSYFVKADEALHIPIHKVSAVDTTCAGDSYIGAFAYMLAKGAPTREALQFAAKVSALVVTKKGAQSSVPTLSEVEAYFSETE